MSLVAVDARGEPVVEWHRPAGTATATRRTVAGWTPSLYVAAPPAHRERVAALLADDPRVAATTADEARTGLGEPPRTLLRVDCTRADEVRAVARRIREADPTPGTSRLYDVDLDPGQRYCLDRGVDPTPPADLRTVTVRLPAQALAEDDPGPLRVDGERVAPDGDPRQALRGLADRLAAVDPDALVLGRAALVPLLADRAAALGVDLQLGRRPGHERLAGASTYTSYGSVGHSPARFAVPGRSLVAEDAAFLWEAGGVGGLRYLAREARLPLGTVARASIGTVLTAIEVRRAREADVLAPWNRWTPERFSPASTLHDADRGGHTLSPDVGHHESVVELDFASLYPAIIREHNVSAETVRCDCHDRTDVPGLGYGICPVRGFLPRVLGPLVDARGAATARLDADRPLDDAARDRLQGVADALKWVLVASFGYQGYRNAKFGRIACHETINAIARETLLDAKATLEAGGWRVVHGIVDSLWVRPRDDVTDPVALEALVAQVSRATGIPLEREGDFEWVCLVPHRDGAGGALTRYFGRRTDGTYKYRGIECRRRDTAAFVATAQRDLVAAVDDAPDPAAVSDRLTGHLAAVRRDTDPVAPEALALTARVSKPPAAYDRETRTVAALRRARDAGFETAPGQSVRYVVVDDDATGRARVRLPHEASPGEHDAGFYADRLVRAAASVTAPLGWDEARLRRHLRGDRDARLSAF